jgi:hypothetical protein
MGMDSRLSNWGWLVRADAQPCYCDEPNCIGYIGGKTQSEAQPKLSHAVKEGISSIARECWQKALGFDEMDVTTRKRRRVKKDDDEDEDYVVAPRTKPVTEDSVARIMSSLLQAREHWVIAQLLIRLEVFYDETWLIVVGWWQCDMASSLEDARIQYIGCSSERMEYRQRHCHNSDPELYLYLTSGFEYSIETSEIYQEQNRRL